MNRQNPDRNATRPKDAKDHNDYPVYQNVTISRNLKTAAKFEPVARGPRNPDRQESATIPRNVRSVAIPTTNYSTKSDSSQDLSAARDNNRNVQLHNGKVNKKALNTAIEATTTTTTTSTGTVKPRNEYENPKNHRPFVRLGTAKGGDHMIPLEWVGPPEPDSRVYQSFQKGEWRLNPRTGIISLSDAAFGALINKDVFEKCYRIDAEPIDRLEHFHFTFFRKTFLEKDSFPHERRATAFCEVIMSDFNIFPNIY